MMDPVRHPDIDETTAWRSWGEVLESHPQMLGGIMSLLPEAETIEEGNRRILALYVWLTVAEHRNVIVARASQALINQARDSATQDGIVPDGIATDASQGQPLPLENHASVAALDAATLQGPFEPLALRVVGQNRHIDPPSHLSMPPSWQVVAVADIEHDDAYQWPHIPADDIAAMVNLPELQGWLEAIHHCEIQWLGMHPETVVARLTAVGELVEDADGDLSLPAVTWEGIGRVISLPVHARNSHPANVEWVNRFLHKEGPDDEARRLREALAPIEILRDERFSKAAIQISYHPPSEAKLASISRDKISSRTGEASGSGSHARL